MGRKKVDRDLSLTLAQRAELAEREWATRAQHVPKGWLTPKQYAEKKRKQGEKQRSKRSD
jgi:hypothetical protein